MSDHEDLDLFGDDPEEEEKAKKLAEEKKKEGEEKKKAKEEAKKKKKKIAKSIVVFDVKGYEVGQDFEKLAKEIKEKIVQEGLVWNKEHTLVPIGFGMKKLRLTMVIVDDLVSVDTIREKIEENWEDDVQSTDIVTFDKI